MAPPFSSSSSPLPLPPPRSPLFVPIPEHGKGGGGGGPASTVSSSYVHKPTPLHHSTSAASSAARRQPSRLSKTQAEVEAVSVSCSTCRPSSRDKLVYVVPLDGGGSSGGGRHQQPSGGGASSSPSRGGGLLRSLFVSLTGRSPAVGSASSSADAGAAVREEQWRLVAAELSRKLVHAARKRDEALHEASRLKYSLAELDSKINELESRCRDLTSSLQSDAAAAWPGSSAPFPTQAFHLAVSDARASVRYLARSLISQLRLGPPGARSSDRVVTLIEPYEPRAAVQWRRNPAGLLSYMEAMLNRAFYGGFEEDEEEEATLVDPAARCAASQAGYEAVRELGWDEVLSKGTRHYSEGLSRFCDRKMSEVVTMVGWARAWPEALLQAFFGAAKGAWVVRLMARFVHPALPVLRADRGTSFDGRYMEDAAAERARRLTPTTVRLLVAPGFHLYAGGGGVVVKCKVLCAYDNSSGSSNCDSECTSDVVSHERPLQQQKGDEGI